MRLDSPDETARYGKLLGRSKTKQNCYSVATVSSMHAYTLHRRVSAEAPSDGLPVSPSTSKPTAFLRLCSPRPQNTVSEFGGTSPIYVPVIDIS